MRISGLDAKFFQDIFEPGKVKPKKAFYSSEDYVIRDRVVISEDARKKLHDYAEEMSKTKWSDNELKYHQNDFLSSIGQTLAHVGQQTENMKYLAILAQDNQITEEERIELQKKMTIMQRDLFILTHNMSFKLADEKYGSKPQMAPKDEIHADYALTMAVLDRQDVTTDYDAWEEKATLSLKDIESAAISTERLTQKIKDLEKKQEELLSYMKSPEGAQAIAEDAKKQKPILEEKNGIIEHKFKKMKGEPMWSDVRLHKPDGVIETLYASWDAFMKDNIYESIGFAGYWDALLDRDKTREIEW